MGSEQETTCFDSSWKRSIIPSSPNQEQGSCSSSAYSKLARSPKIKTYELGKQLSAS
jgi:hypothetical protein